MKHIFKLVGDGGEGGGREFYRSLEAPHSILLIS